MGYRMVGAQTIWRHDGTEGISGAVDGIRILRPGANPAVDNGTMVASPGVPGDWTQIDLVGVDKLLLQMDATFDDLGAIVGVASANTRLACIGVPYYDPLIDEAPEPVGRNPGDTDSADPTGNQIDILSLSFSPWQYTEDWEPVLHEAAAAVDAGIIPNNTTPETTLRSSWVGELGILRMTADAVATGDTAATTQDMSVSLLDRAWLVIFMVNQFLTATFDGTERIRIAINALKYQEVDRIDTGDIRTRP